MVTCSRTDDDLLVQLLPVATRTGRRLPVPTHAPILPHLRRTSCTPKASFVPVDCAAANKCLAVIMVQRVVSFVVLWLSLLWLLFGTVYPSTDSMAAMAYSCSLAWVISATITTSLSLSSISCLSFFVWLGCDGVLGVIQSKQILHLHIHVLSMRSLCPVAWFAYHCTISALFCWRPTRWPVVIVVVVYIGPMMIGVVARDNNGTTKKNDSTSTPTLASNFLGILQQHFDLVRVPPLHHVDHSRREHIL